MGDEAFGGVGIGTSVVEGAEVELVTGVGGVVEVLGAGSGVVTIDDGEEGVSEEAPLLEASDDKDGSLVEVSWAEAHSTAVEKYKLEIRKR